MVARAAANQRKPSPAPRLEQTTVCLPIVYGSVAFYLGKKADEYKTHQWTLYVRGRNNEDLSSVVSKVVFQLHASFAQPVRELTAPPFEVTERGWGEFEAQIRIEWKDPSEQPALVTHGIKLYPPGAPANAVPTDTVTPVVAESYDELVFTNPTETFFGQLQQLANQPPLLEPYSQQKHFQKFSDTQDFQALLAAQRFLQQGISRVKERLQAVDTDLAQVDEALRETLEQNRANLKAGGGVSTQSTTGSRGSTSKRTARSSGVVSAVSSKKAKTN